VVRDLANDVQPSCSQRQVTVYDRRGKDRRFAILAPIRYCAMSFSMLSETSWRVGLIDRRGSPTTPLSWRCVTLLVDRRWKRAAHIVSPDLGLDVGGQAAAAGLVDFAGFATCTSLVVVRR